MNATIVVLAGDGIGPEVTAEARRLLEQVAGRWNHAFSFDEQLLGGCAIDATGTALPEATLAACRGADAVLLGAVGGPKWDDPNAAVRPEQGLLGLRKALGLYANLRPVAAIPLLAGASPLKAEKLHGVDMVIVRELTGGLYFGQPRLRETLPDGRVRAVDTLEYTDEEIRRIVRLAFRLAAGRRRKVTSVDKANVLESSRLWRQIAAEVGREHPDIALEHQLVDSCAMRLVTHPADFDVVVTENMFGDILSDEASVLTGSLGMLPSASLGEGRIGLYEPIHGSAPDIAGRGVANPLATILSAALLLRHSLRLEAEAAAVERAVHAALDAGLRTRDLGGDAGTRAAGDAVLAQLSR
ncbi:MAG TPA: 3-isopropylmalate dehydrogenase [Kofleriaceae bacterium]|nr:3-isopropylmalate dehydrogenase [Kofleriaceae bacterium]